MSKKNCWAVTSPKKRTRWVRFVRFLGEFTARQFCFEIYRLTFNISYLKFPDIHTSWAKLSKIDYCVIFSNDRKKIKGRGRLTYRPDRSRSRSQTPPHWRAEKRKTISLDEYEKLKVEKAKKMDEIERRAEDRRRRHEVWLTV